MPRYCLTIEYDGTPFVGWQKQTNGVSVQSTLTDAIEKFSRTIVTPFGAGRTDAGVHALGQVAHIDLAKATDPNTLREALNHYLKPAPIAILSVELVSPEFDARFSAIARHYRYKILNRRPPATLNAGYIWWVSKPLDIEAMTEAAQLLIGCHDFTTFRAADCQASSPVKTLDRLDVRREGEEVHIEASARSFMHSQVRSLVGSLKLVGTGKWSKQDLAAALVAKRRSACGPVAPARGLYFVKVDYPVEARAGTSQ